MKLPTHQAFPLSLCVLNVVYFTLWHREEWWPFSKLRSYAIFWQLTWSAGLWCLTLLRMTLWPSRWCRDAHSFWYCCQYLGTCRQAGNDRLDVLWPQRHYSWVGFHHCHYSLLDVKVTKSITSTISWQIDCKKITMAPSALVIVRNQCIYGICFC